jgi:hypothetical protein
MIGDLCTLLRAQEFSTDITTNGVTTTYTVSEVYARRADEGAVIPYVVVNRDGGDRNETLDGNDESLFFTDVTIEVHSNQPAIDVPIAESIAEFLDTSLNITMGSRTLFGCMCDQPIDFDNPPEDASDEWNGGTKLTAHLEHN